MALKSKVTVHVSLICIELVVISLCASTCFIFVSKLFYIINHAILYNINAFDFLGRVNSWNADKSYFFLNRICKIAFRSRIVIVFIASESYCRSQVSKLQFITLGINL